MVARPAASEVARPGGARRGLDPGTSGSCWVARPAALTQPAFRGRLTRQAGERAGEAGSGTSIRAFRGRLTRPQGEWTGEGRIEVRNGDPGSITHAAGERDREGHAHGPGRRIPGALTRQSGERAGEAGSGPSIRAFRGRLTRPQGEWAGEGRITGTQRRFPGSITHAAGARDREGHAHGPGRRIPGALTRQSGERDRGSSPAPRVNGTAACARRVTARRGRRLGFGAERQAPGGSQREAAGVWAAPRARGGPRIVARDAASRDPGAMDRVGALRW